MRTVCPDCFRGAEEEGACDGILGQPEVMERESGLGFRHETVTLHEPLAQPILDITPVQSFDRNLWVAVTRAGELLRIDLDERSPSLLCRLPDAAVNLSEQVSLHVSGDGRFAAVVNTKGRSGVVVDLKVGKAIMSLDRGDYRYQHCTFPVAFCEMAGRLLLIHGTAWNRLDVSDPETGELLTARSPTSYQRDEDRPEHYLDYFHCGLTVSPDQEYIADNGWVWHPVGVVASWSIRRWLRDNVWESEDGGSKKRLCRRNYFWDGPLCWVGGDRLAVWGYGEDADWLLPAVRIFDVKSGQEERWFPGPKGALVFDGWLYSSDPDAGTTVWDATTGERLLREAAFCPLRYHRGAKSFLTLKPGGLFQVSRLRGRPVDPAWLSWNDGVVAKMAQAIRDERSFDRLPILADALEEAGCTDAEFLNHCRERGPHGRGCWVVDLLAGGE